MVIMVKIVEEDLRKGVLKVIPENPDDLWLLYNIIAPGDIVRAQTSREIKGEKGASSRRIPMVLAIRVKKMEFQPFTERLRIRGIVVEGPERFGVKGHYHTINLELGKPITIIKEKWSQYLVKRIRESVKPRGRILLVALDYDEAAIALVSDQGVNILYEESARLPGKNKPEQFEHGLKNYVNGIVQKIIDSIARHRPEILIIASPGGLAETVRRELLGRGINVRIMVDHISIGGRAGIQEILRRDVFKESVKELSVIEADRILNEFRMYLAKNPDMIAYGLDEVEEAARMNAVEKLVVIEDLIHSYDEEERRRVERILDEVYRRRGKIIILPSRTDLAQELKAFTGIIAVLRFPYKRVKDTPVQ